MEAAKRMYDNSYSERQETASLAMAYLNDNKAKPAVEEAARKRKGNVICNLVGIVTSIIYCMVILGLLLMPLIRETQLAQLKIKEDTYKKHIEELQKEIEDTEILIKSSQNMNRVEKDAESKLGLVRKSNVEVQTIFTKEKLSLKDARDAYYNRDLNYSSTGK